MRADRVLSMARRLAEEENLEGLRLLVRMAALPLQAEALLGWTERDPYRKLRLEDALPERVAPRLQREEEEVYAVFPPGSNRPVALEKANAVVSFPWSPGRMEKVFREIAPQRWKYYPFLLYPSHPQVSRPRKPVAPREHRKGRL